MALALYRKYRPATFAEVVGQEHVTEPLSTALAAGRINHAYLFSGPRGCGKTSSARILARSLNCEQGPTPTPCGVCSSCVALAPGGPGNIDVTELDAASHNGVDDARGLRDRTAYSPAESRYRVIILDEAHMITTAGFNALLKVVEEPPEHLIFVFATTEPEKLLPTIRSRTHHYPFRLIPPGTLRALLERICADEGVVVAPTVFPLVIRAGGGSARDSLSILDQLLSGAGPEGVTYERAVALLGVTDVALIDDVVDGLAAGDRAAVFETVDRLVEAGLDPRRFASDLLQRVRDVTLLQAVPEAAARGLVEAADDELARIAEQAGHLDAGTLARYGEILHTGLTEMRGATAPRLLLELLCARMLLPAATTGDGGLLERLERLERRSAIDPGPAAIGEQAPDADAAAGRRTFRRRGTEGAPPDDAGPRAAESDAARPDPARPDPARPDPARPDPAPSAPAAPPTASPAAPAGAAASPVTSTPAPARTPSAAAPVPSAAAPAAAPTAQTRPAPAPEAVPRDARRPVAGGPPEAEGAPDAEGPSTGRSALPAPSGRADAGSAPTGGDPQAAAAAAPAPAAASLDATAVRRVWPEILASTRTQSRSIEAMLVNATVRALDGDTLVIGMGVPSLARRMSEPKNTDVVTAALHAVLGVRWQVRFEHGDGPAPATRAATPPPAPARRPPPVRRSVARDDGEPLPPEPADEEAPPDDEESMLAEAAATQPVVGARRDPEEEAIELLTSQLGARTIDRG